MLEKKKGGYNKSIRQVYALQQPGVRGFQPVNHEDLIKIGLASYQKSNYYTTIYYFY